MSISDPFHDEARAAQFAERAVSYAFVVPMGQESSGRRKCLDFSVSANLACYGPLAGSAIFTRASRCAFGKLSSTGSPRSRAPHRGQRDSVGLVVVDDRCLRVAAGHGRALRHARVAFADRVLGPRRRHHEHVVPGTG